MSSDTWHIESSVKCRIKKERKIKKIEKLRKNMRMTSGMEESGGKFPPLVHKFGGWMRIK